MDGEKGKMDSDTHGNVSISRGFPVEPWHSTPVKKNLFPTEETPDISSVKLREENRTRPSGLSPQNLSKPMSFISLQQDSQMPANGLEISTIQKQRLELQLLIAELKDRDQELNAMSAAHHRQLLSWEQDRQRVLILEQRCARLQDELNGTQQQLNVLNQTQLNATRHQQDLQEKNQSLNSTIMKLSSQVGQLYVREEKLSSMLKLKDKDVIEATSHISELSDHICELEKTLEELQTREIKALWKTEEHKQSCKKSRHENAQLMAELQEKTIESNRQREEVIRLKQENQLLRNELSVVELELLSGDKSWKDELLELSRSKQARAESELLCLRQVCENQQNDLQLLKLNLESVRETLRQHEVQRSPGWADSGLGSSHVIEKSDQQEIDTGIISSLQNNSPGRSLSSDLSQHPYIEAETPIDFKCTTLSVKNPEATEQEVGEDNDSVYTTASKGTISEPDLDDYQKEMTEKGMIPSNENSSGPWSTRPVSPALCFDNSDNPTEIRSHPAVCSEPKDGVDFEAVIDYNPDMGTPVFVIDVDLNPRFSCVTELHLDGSSPSPGSGRDPGLSIEFYDIEPQEQEGLNSSTSRLQRLLAVSREMVASLEGSSRKPVSPAQSPTNTDDACQLQSIQDSDICHSQSFTRSQEGSKASRDSESPIS